MKLRKIAAVLTAVALLVTSATVMPFAAGAAENVPSVTAERGFVIASANNAADIYVDPQGSEYDGLSIIAEAFSKDVELVSGEKPEVKTDLAKVSGTPIIAGAIDENDSGIISQLISSNKISVSDIRGKWETYKIQVVDNPTDDISKALVIVGSDKRGTIYGMFHVSEMMGVSPWVYWGDVIPAHRDTVSFSADELNMTSKEPSVKYRGIFINDESPNFTDWAKNKFGDVNYLLYDKLYEVILRLKGNYLWPAMWSDVFSKDGISQISDESLKVGQDALSSARLADKYGVIMGTSHHEPMCRAGSEWGQEYKTYLNEADAAKGSRPTWDYFNYRYAIKDFWKDGYNRNKDFENVITVGMRGEADSSLGLSLKDSVQNLKNVITDQFDIMTADGAEQPPTILCLYKEVEEYWYGGYDEENSVQVEGLKDWKDETGKNPLDDTSIMLCDDNFGNLRTLPQEDERNRKGGWGMYYHFDYNGVAHNYMWLATNQLEKTWENMQTCYDYGIRNMWIVNVGDFKPMEVNTSYFLDLAYDIDTYGQNGAPQAYYAQWAKQQFGDYVDDTTANGIGQVLNDYLKMNGARKPEKLFASTFSLTDYNEAQKQLAKANDLCKRAYEYDKLIPDNLKDAYYQLVLYPAVASANCERWVIYSALNKMYANEGSILANKYAALVDECEEIDIELHKKYNSMAGGKWNGMQTRSVHIGYNQWNASYDKTGSYVEPEGEYVVPEPGMTDAIIMNTDTNTAPAETGTEISFSNLYKEAHALTVSHKLPGTFEYTAVASDDWIKLSKTSGKMNTGDVIGVSVDWDKVSESKTGTVTISGLDTTVTITVKADVKDVSGLSDGTAVGKDGTISVLAEDYTSASGEWVTIENYGREKSSVKAKNFTADYKTADNVYLEYSIYAEKAGNYYLTVYSAPTNNRTTGSRLPYGVSVNNGSVQEVNTLPESFDVGSSSVWSEGVINNARITTTQISLNSGENKIRIYSLGSGTVLQKIVVSENQKLSGAAFGAPSSYIKGNTAEQQQLVSDIPDNAAIIPGEIEATDKNVIVSDTVAYNIYASGTISEDAKISIKLDGTEIAVLSYDAQTGKATASPEEEIIAGAYELSYEVTAGTVDITSFTFERNDDRVKMEVLNDTFADASRLEAYTAYKPDTSGAALSIASEKIHAQFDKSYGADNGIKIDVTQLLKGASGLTIGASADVHATWTGTARIFFDVVSASGTKTVLLKTDTFEGENRDLSLKGETEEMTFGPKDTVYLCVAQTSGQADFDNIKLWFWDEPVEPGKAITVFKHTFNTDKAAQAALYEPYEENGGTVEGGYSTVMKYTKGESTPKEKGVRINITNMLSTDWSGCTFGASALLKPGYSWSDADYADIFFEVTDSAGAVTKIPLGKATPDNTSVANGTDSETGADLGTNWLTAPVNGETVLEYDADDTIYLCITASSDEQWYDDIILYYLESEVGPKPPVGDETITLYNSTTDGVTDWKFYNDELTEKAGQTGDNGNTIGLSDYGNGTLGAQYGNNWDGKNGIKLDVTEYIKECESGSTFDISYTLGNGAWKGDSGLNMPSVFFEVNGVQTKLNISAPESEKDIKDGNPPTADVKASGALEFADGDTVYLCFTHGTGYHSYSNIVLNGVKNGAGEASAKISVTKPVLDGGEAYVIASNTTGEAAKVRIYAAKYDEDETLNAVSITDAEIAAGELNKKIAFKADAGDTVFIWDNDMKPLTEKTVLEV